MPVVDPLFWLGLSILLVAVSLTAVLLTALPALRELSRASRSAEKLFETLNRELPPTLESIRLTGMEITNLTDDISQSVQGAGRVVAQLDQSISGVKQQAKQAQVTTRSVFAGVKAAWRAFSRPTPPRRSRSINAVESADRLPPNTRSSLNFEEEYPSRSAIGLDETTDSPGKGYPESDDLEEADLEPNPRESSTKNTPLFNPENHFGRPTEPTKTKPLSRDYRDQD